MSGINVLFGITKPVVEVLRGNFKRNAEDTGYEANQLTDEERERFKTYTTEHWKDEINGAVTWQLVSSYLSRKTVDKDNPDNLELVDVVDAIDKFAGNIFVIGAWNKDGTQYGTTLTKVENGVDSIENQDKVISYTNKDEVDFEATIIAGEVVYKSVQIPVVTYVGNGTFTEYPHFDEVITGTPVYPINIARVLKYIPDDITYDDDGNELSRAVATVPKEINNILGWKPRRWS